jgi:radical SAM/Cys-rich protein
MELETIERILRLIDKSSGIEVLDLTGGAPEMNSHFRYFVSEAKKRGLKVIDRCNLTILLEEGYEDVAQFLADNEVHIVASLPCYSKDNVEKQRGRGVFGKSIDALQLLNELGYATSNDNLVLDLVYNPLGATLPPAQDKLESSYKKELRELFHIEFNSLYTITNMPIKRFLHQLKREDQYESYMALLASNFNLHALQNVMCKELISISWDGELFDCDFNQMLELQPSNTKKTVWDIDSFCSSVGDIIALGDHCYGCTAGAGSSCGGSLA